MSKLMGCALVNDSYLYVLDHAPVLFNVRLSTLITCVDRVVYILGELLISSY